MSSTSKATSRSTEGGLVPGYRHVEEFGPEDEYEDEVEESYVTLDLGSVDQTLVPSSSSYRLIGLDSSTPFLQLSGTIMKGHHQTLLGTELIFKDVSEETESPPHGNVRYFTTTNRRIAFREVELKPKTAAPPPPPPRKVKFIISGPPTTAEQTADVDTSASASQIPELIQESGENLVQRDTGGPETSQISNNHLPTAEILEDEDMYVDE